MKKTLISLFTILTAISYGQEKINATKADGTIYKGYSSTVLNSLSTKPEGFWVYNSTTHSFWYWNGTSFKDIAEGGAGETYTAGTGLNLSSGEFSIVNSELSPAWTNITGKPTISGTNTGDKPHDATPTSGSTNGVESRGVYTALAGKQATLVSGTNIKTIGGQSILGSGNISIPDNTIIVNNLTSTSATSALSANQGKVLNDAKQNNLISGTNIKTINSNSLLGSGNINIPDDQTAAEVTSTPSGDLTSTNVQAALEELNANKVGSDPNSPISVPYIAVGSAEDLDAADLKPGTLEFALDGDIGTDGYVDGVAVTGTTTKTITLTRNGLSPISTTFTDLTSGGSGTVDWGAIGGTLSDQSDLKSSLDNRGVLDNANDWLGRNLFDQQVVMTHPIIQGQRDIYSPIEDNRWRYGKDISDIGGDFKFSRQSVASTDYTGSYTDLYKFNATGIPSDDTDIITKGYADANYSGGGGSTAWNDITGKPSTFTPSAHTHNASDINAGTLAIARIPTGTSSSTVSLGNHTHSYASITGKPSTFAPSAHTHTASDVTDFDTEVANNPAVAANTAKTSNATHTGDVTGATVLTIGNDKVTNAKMANMAVNTIKGRKTSGTGDPEDLTASDVRDIIELPISSGVFTATLETSGSGSYTYNQSSSYYKVGRLVFVSIRFSSIATVGSPSGFLQITNLPYTISSNKYAFQVGEMSSLSSDTYSIMAKAESITDGVRFYVRNSTTGSMASGIMEDVSLSGNLVVTGTYLTN